MCLYRNMHASMLCIYICMIIYIINAYIITVLSKCLHMKKGAL